MYFPVAVAYFCTANRRQLTSLLPLLPFVPHYESQSCAVLIKIPGVRRFVLDEFVFGDLDYEFAVGVWGFGVGVLGFWAWDEFWGRIVTDSKIPTDTSIINDIRLIMMIKLTYLQSSRFMISNMPIMSADGECCTKRVKVVL